jgi:hypothetical protein
MEVGYLLEKGENNRKSQATWVEGAPEASFWTGMKTGDRRQLPVLTYRCRQCGWLDFYAREA